MTSSDLFFTKQEQNRTTTKRANPGLKDVSTSTMTSSSLPDAVRSVADQNSFDDFISRFRLNFDEDSDSNQKSDKVFRLFNHDKP